MKALWTFISAFAAFSINSIPAFAQEDFSTHNRFHFAKNPWPQEQERLPAIHDIPHSVRAGQVSVPPVPIDSLTPAPTAPPTAALNPILFGRPRSLPATTAPAPAPFVAVSQQLPVTPTIIKPHATNAVKIPAPIQFARPTAPGKPRPQIAINGRLKPPTTGAPVIPASYPVDLGYSYGSSSLENSSTSKHQAEVHGKILTKNNP